MIRVEIEEEKNKGLYLVRVLSHDLSFKSRMPLLVPAADWKQWARLLRKLAACSGRGEIVRTPRAPWRVERDTPSPRVVGARDSSNSGHSRANDRRNQFSPRTD